MPADHATPSADEYSRREDGLQADIHDTPATPTAELRIDQLRYALVDTLTDLDNPDLQCHATTRLHVQRIKARIERALSYERSRHDRR